MTGRPTNAAFEAAGLYDPSAPNARDRLALLEWLVAQGVSLEQMVVYAQRHASLTGLAGDLALRPGRRLRLAELAALVGVGAERIAEIRLAYGLPPVDPDEPMFTEEDAAAFASYEVFAQLFGEQAARQFSRVLGASLARIAEAAISLFLVNLEGPIAEAGAGDLALAQANLQAIRTIEGFVPTLQSLIRAHFETAIRRLRQARHESSVDVVRLAVGFVDLVGFTPLARQLSPRDLGAVVDRFEGLAHDVTAARDGRIVKLIGDEVMFVALNAAAACDIALTLVERTGEDASVSPRGGLAAGDLLMRGGDYYGPIVNLASRIAELAVPHEILITGAVAEQAGDGSFCFEPAGKRMLKGFDQPVTLFSAARG